MLRLNVARLQGHFVRRVLTSRVAVGVVGVAVLVGAVAASSAGGDHTGRFVSDSDRLPLAPPVVSIDSGSSLPDSVELLPTPPTSVPSLQPSSVAVAPPAPQVRPAPSAEDSSTEVRTGSPPVPAGQSSNGGAAVGVTYTAFVTGYGYFDNTPPGSSRVAYPVLHQSAGGVGTYADPVTVAVGHSMATGHDVLDFGTGTRFYIAGLHRYFIVEDTCGDGPRPQDGPCHDLSGAPAGAQIWLDVWTDGEGGNRSLSANCAEQITRNYSIIRDPSPDLPVNPGPINDGSTCSPKRTRQTIAERKQSQE